MKFHYECLNCNLNQVLKTTSLLETNDDKTEAIIRRVLEYLSCVDYNKCNPEILKGTFKIITDEVGVEDPYYALKTFYNRAALALVADVNGIIEDSSDKFTTALKIAIAGNLIDFASGHFFDEKVLIKTMNEIETAKLVIDNSKDLLGQIKNSKNLLYLGDNCGEIVFDKIFIEYLKKLNPDLKVSFAVRGKAIINDVTLYDAKMVAMQSIATVVENGDGASGTVLKDTNPKFRKIYQESELIIAKGQGNFESLSDDNHDNLYFLMMAKCEVVAKLIGVKKGSIVCFKNR